MSASKVPTDTSGTKTSGRLTGVASGSDGIGVPPGRCVNNFRATVFGLSHGASAWSNRLAVPLSTSTRKLDAMAVHGAAATDHCYPVEHKQASELNMDQISHRWLAVRF